MELALTIKDLIYILVYVISIVTVFNSVKNRLSNMSNKILTIEEIMFKDNGGLNLVNQESCKERRDIIDDEIKKGEAIMDETSRNVIKIMLKLGVEPVGRTKP